MVNGRAGEPRRESQIAGSTSDGRGVRGARMARSYRPERSRPDGTRGIYMIREKSEQAGNSTQRARGLYLRLIVPFAYLPHVSYCTDPTPSPPSRAPSPPPPPPRPCFE